MEDQPADPGVLTPDTDAADPPRRWWKLRRKNTSPEPEPEAETPEDVSEPDTTDEAPAAARVPVGKRKRAAAAGSVAAADAEPDEEPVEKVDEEPADEEVADSVEAVADEPEPDPEPEPADEDVDDSVEAVADESDPDEDPVLAPHRPAAKRWIIAAAAASAVFVAAGAFAGAMVQPYLADRALADTKLEVARTASEAIATLWTYTPEDMETLPNRAEKYLAGEFSEQYRLFIDAIAPTNKQSQVTNNTEVVGTAVESISPTAATALVYTNTVATSPTTENIPSLRYLSYRLTMERQNSEWLINRMTAITQLDLMPQL